MADHPLRPATRLCLGEPSPHQLADRTRTLLEVIACRSRGHLLPQGANPSWSYPVLVRLSTGYPSLQGRLSTCYSPVRRFTRRVAPTFSHDLHVSGTPPAFVLSQDQTLHVSSFCHPDSTRANASSRMDRPQLNKPKKPDGLGPTFDPRRPIKGMHYYSVFKDQPDFEAKLNPTARPRPCQIAMSNRYRHCVPSYPCGRSGRAEFNAPGARCSSAQVRI